MILLTTVEPTGIEPVTSCSTAQLGRPDLAAVGWEKAAFRGPPGSEAAVTFRVVVPLVLSVSLCPHPLLGQEKTSSNRASDVSRLGYVWGPQDGEWAILPPDEGSGILKASPRSGVQQLAMFAEQQPPWGGPPLHRHDDADEIFYSLEEARVLVEQWRREYNTVRPHSALGYRPPAPEAVRPSSWFLKRPSLLGPPDRLRMAVGLT